MTTQGQVLNGSPFRMWIDKTITDYKPNTIVEIGTWKGLRTTKRIIDSIEKNQITPTFISLESNLSFYETATRNLKDKPIKIPPDIFLSGEIFWDKSELKFKNMEFTGIRIIKSPELLKI